MTQHLLLFIKLNPFAHHHCLSHNIGTCLLHNISRMANNFINLIAHFEMPVKPDERWLNVINISSEYNYRNRVRWIGFGDMSH